MYILTATANATGSWYRVLFGGDFVIANKAADTLGGGSLVIEFADTSSVALKMPSSATFSAPIESQVITLARGSLVRAKLTGSTSPACNVFLENTTIQGPTLQEVT